MLRDERNRRRRQRRSRKLLIGEPAAVLAARTARIKAMVSDLKAESGHAATLRRAKKIGAVGYKFGVGKRAIGHRWWQVARAVIGLRSTLAQRQAEVTAGLWRRWDERLGKMGRPISWRVVIPEAYDYETIFGDFLDKLQPDVLHAHDMHVIGVASRAAGRAALRRTR